MDRFLKQASDFAYSEVNRTGMPIRMHVDLSSQMGKELAIKLNANPDIVQAGTILMDCMLGEALKKGRQKDHIQMSLDKTNELLEKSNLDAKTKENIRHCVLEHHGVRKFFSLESEICCNADCYRFASVKGFLIATRYLRDMPFEDLCALLKSKADEKAHALSLNICKEELGDQIRLINSILKHI